jgi:hypothetical protein
LRAHANPREWPGAVRAAPRRKLIGAGVVGCVALGALITFLVTGSEPEPMDAVAPRIPAAPAPAPPEPTVQVVGPAALPTAPPSTPAPATAEKPTEPKPAQSTSSPGSVRRPSAPARNPTPPKKNAKRDYGI